MGFVITRCWLKHIYFDNNNIMNTRLIQLGIRTKEHVLIKFFSQKQWACIHNGEFKQSILKQILLGDDIYHLQNYTYKF